MSYSLKIAFFITGAALSLFWVFLFFYGKRKYSKYIEALPKDFFLLQEAFFVGCAFLELTKKKKREIAELHDKYADFYYFVLRGGEATLILTCLPLGLLLSIFAENSGVVALGLIVAGVFCMLMEDQYKSEVRDKRESLLIQFPAVLSKLTLLINSGMVMRDAWTLVASQGKGILYKEMLRVSEELNNGKTEVEAYKAFAERCNVKEIRKFTSTVQQNLQKGSRELVPYLIDMSSEVWNAKEYSVRSKADAAARKLMIPTLMIFCGILVMIIVPMINGIAL